MNPWPLERRVSSLPLCVVTGKSLLPPIRRPAVWNFVFLIWKILCNIPLKWGHNVVYYSQAEPALMYDSVHVFAKGLSALDRSHVLKPANLSCDLEQPWDDGLSLYNYINSVSNKRFLLPNLLLFWSIQTVPQLSENIDGYLPYKSK